MPERTSPIATNVNDYTPSLWHYIGQLRATYTLRALVDQMFNDRMDGRNVTYPIVLIVGDNNSGRRTLARSLHLAVGNLYWKESTLLPYGSSDCLAEFFSDSSEFTTFYIPNFTRVSIQVGKQLANVIRDGFCYRSVYGQPNQIVPVINSLIILSIQTETTINPDVAKYIDVRCDLNKYSQESIRQILKQRIACLNWSMSDTSIELICDNAHNNPGIAIKMLQQCYMISRAENKDKIDITHAKKALTIQPQEI